MLGNSATAAKLSSSFFSSSAVSKKKDPIYPGYGYIIDIKSLTKTLNVFLERDVIFICFREASLPSQTIQQSC